MKISTLVKCAALLSLSVSHSVLAVDSPGWIGPTTIEYITVQPNDNIYVKVAGNVLDLGCESNASGLLQINTSAPFYKEQLSLLTAAHMAKRKVRIYMKSCGYFPYAENTTVY